MQHKSPSQIMKIKDSYVSFCFDEACEYIRAKIANGEEPVYEKRVTNMREFYAELGAG